MERSTTVRRKRQQNNQTKLGRNTQFYENGYTYIQLSLCVNVWSCIIVWLWHYLH